jgi:nucleoporin GLE1
MNLYSFQCQAEVTVSSRPEAAFAFAAVIQALWADFPDFRQLVLGHFHRACPYLVPIFMPQVEGQSTEDYYK